MFPQNDDARLAAMHNDIRRYHRARNGPARLGFLLAAGFALGVVAVGGGLWIVADICRALFGVPVRMIH